MKKRKIGFRIYKTAIAVMISVFISQLTKSEYPFFAGMTALISMDKTSGNSIQMGKNRVVGTILGACLGVVLSTIDRGNIFLCGIGMIILILIFVKLKLQGAVTIGGIVMLAIMVHTDTTPLFYAIHRTVDTLIGAIVSLIVNVSFYPYLSKERLEDMTIRIWDETDKFVAALKNHEVLDTAVIKKEMYFIKLELDTYHTELFARRRMVWVDKLQKHYDMAKRLLLEFEILETISKENHPEIYDYHFEAALKTYDSYIDELQTKK